VQLDAVKQVPHCQLHMNERRACMQVRCKVYSAVITIKQTITSRIMRAIHSVYEYPNAASSRKHSSLDHSQRRYRWVEISCLLCQIEQGRCPTLAERKETHRTASVRPAIWTDRQAAPGRPVSVTSVRHLEQAEEKRKKNMFDPHW